MEPLRCWKELVLGERALRPKKSLRLPCRRENGSRISGPVHAGLTQ